MYKKQFSFITHFLSSWLLKYPGLIVRSSEPQYVDKVRKYNSKLLPLLADLQFIKGGPIIAFQVSYISCLIQVHIICIHELGKASVCTCVCLHVSKRWLVWLVKHYCSCAVP
jgi:hypothetical protein